MLLTFVQGPNTWSYLILFYLSIIPLTPTPCLFLNEWVTVLDVNTFRSGHWFWMILNLRAYHGSLQRSCFRSFEWWNECTCSAIIKIRPKGSLFFLTIPFKRECYCQWSLACKSGNYQKCHEAAWTLCNFLQVEGAQMSQWRAAFHKSEDQQTDKQTESSEQGQSIRNRTTYLQT